MFRSRILSLEKRLKKIKKKYPNPSPLPLFIFPGEEDKIPPDFDGLIFEFKVYEDQTKTSENKKE